MTLRTGIRGIAFVVALAASIAGSEAAEWGTLKGRFVYSGAAPAPKKLSVNKDVAVCGKHNLVDEGLVVGPKGGVANVVVYVRDKKVAVHPDFAATAKDEVVLDNTKCRFEPHVVVMRTSQTLVLKNSDPVAHNSNLATFANPAINPIIPVGGKINHSFPLAEGRPVKVGCNIHPWMGAWIVVRNNPYATVSAKDGTFEIKNLPAGSKLEFQLWQESIGYVKNAKTKLGKADRRGRIEIKIKPGMNDLGDIKFKSK